MRHSNVRMMTVIYTDVKLLNVSGALDSVPKLTPGKSTDNKRDTKRATDTDTYTTEKSPPHGIALKVHSESFPDVLAGDIEAKPELCRSRKPLETCEKRFNRE